MKRLSVLVAAALFLLAATVHADDPAGPSVADDPTTMKAIAARLHDEATDIRRVAADEHAKAQKECWKKFLVSKCLDEVGQNFRNEKLKAANLDSRARGIERELKRREIAERDAQRAAKDATPADKQ